MLLFWGAVVVGAFMLGGPVVGGLTILVLLLLPEE